MQRQEPSQQDFFVEIVGGYHELVQGSLNYTPLKINMSPKKGTFSIGNTSSNHHFSGDMLVFRGVHPRAPKSGATP